MVSKGDDGMNNTCESNKVIERCKKKLLEGTNIESSPEEMAVLDNILFRFWQMGWLDNDTKVTAADCISRQAAIDSLGEEPPIWYDGEEFLAERSQWRRDVNAIKAVPSIQSDVSGTIQNAINASTGNNDYMIGLRNGMRWCLSVLDGNEPEFEECSSAQSSVSKTETVEDCISRQAAISEIMEDLEDRSLHDDPATPEDYAEGYDEGIRNAAAIVLQMPSAQLAQDLPKGCTDTISRQAVRYKLTALVNEFEEILSHIREREVDDSVCGLCEYDGAYIGQSGDWCNECPGFEKDDCFKLREKYRKEWTDLDG